MNRLKNTIIAEELDEYVNNMRGDVRKIDIANEKVDLIFSNELLCELDRSGLESAFREFYRVLKKGGKMIHAELDPVPENRAQELLIEADLHYSSEYLPFQGERWFSPPVNELLLLMEEAGFKT